MGRKHKHSQDKLYKTVSELTSRHVGESRDFELSASHRRLKFDSCCLSLNAATKRPTGLCDDTGFCFVFEREQIIRFLSKHNQIHPVTGQKVSVKDLFDLKFHKNADGQFHCPVSFKLLTPHSKIVANRKSGHVYSYQTYYDMNLKAKYFKDLLTDEPFNKADVVTIQDPDLSVIKWNVSEFHFVKNKLRIEDDLDGCTIRNIDNQSSILKSSLEEYRQRADEIVDTFYKIVGQDQIAPACSDEKLDKINSAAYSDGKMSSSVTSTVMPVARTQKAAQLSEDEIIYPRIKKRAHVQLLTNFGPINLELFCDRTPKTCHNFLQLISRNYYDNTIFHRLIKNFILQGGDPTGTGSGGQSAWGQPFRDEFCGDLKHEGRGVLAMANSGPNTNKSQFYITLRGTWDHLDKKHTVFGRVVGGIATLEKIEAEVETDKNDRPKKEVKIIKATKFNDPFEEVQKSINAERGLIQDKTKKRPSNPNDNLVDKKPIKKMAITSESPDETSRTIGSEAEESTQNACDQSDKLASPIKPQVKTTPVGKKSSYGNFDNW